MFANSGDMLDSRRPSVEVKMASTGKCSCCGGMSRQVYVARCL